MSILDDARKGMNPDIRPQDDLFGHVNGRWLEEVEIPSDRSSWGPFVELADAAEEHVRVIIEELASGEPRDVNHVGRLKALVLGAPRRGLAGERAGLARGLRDRAELRVHLGERHDLVLGRDPREVPREFGA